MDALTLSRGDALDEARRWLDQADDERRRQAVAACRDRAEDALWALTRSYLLINGSAGARVSSHTLRAYRSALRALLRGWSDQPLLHPRRNAAHLLIRGWEREGISPATVTVRLAAARCLYAALRWAGATDADPFRDVKPARDLTPSHEKRKPYSPDGFQRLVDAATGSDLLLILLAGHAGLRCAECLALQWTHVDLDSGTLRVVDGKGGKSADVILSRSLHTALDAAPHPNAYVIPDYRSTDQARRRLKALCLRAGVKPLGVHSLRHHAGTVLYQRTGKLEVCQRALRHASISTTQIYVHYADDELRAAVADW